MPIDPRDLVYKSMTWAEFEAAMNAAGFTLKFKAVDPDISRLEYAAWESMSDREPYRITRGHARLTAFPDYLQKVSDRLMVTEKENQYKVFRAAFRFASMD